jgi:putative NIF3 family GTP cyclohydrolase 1 type 2
MKIMKRRQFIVTAGLGSLAIGLNAGRMNVKVRTAGELNAYLRSLYHIPEPSCDRIIIGDPDTAIKRVGTVWMPYLSTLKEAVARGVNVMIVHEPTFYTHWDLDAQDYNIQSYYNIPSPAREQYIETVNEKKKWIEKNGLVIIRSHDMMDIVKSYGMPYALGRKMGFADKDIIRSRDYYNVYRVGSDSAKNVAAMIAARLKNINQPGVGFYGDPERIVSSVGMGAGCICDPQNFADMNPDMYVVVDDKMRAWIQGTYAEDTGIPTVVINHGVAEEFGMLMLNQHLSGAIPDLEFIHFNQGCSYRWISA